MHMGVLTPHGYNRSGPTWSVLDLHPGKVSQDIPVEDLHVHWISRERYAMGLMVEDLEKYMSKWRRLNNSDLTPSIEEELKRLADQMQKAYVETQGEIEAVSQELRSLKVKKVKLADAIEASNNALASA